MTYSPLSFLVKASDQMARVALDWVDRKVIDSRSSLADALLEYAEIRCPESHNPIQSLRELLDNSNSLTATSDDN